MRTNTTASASSPPGTRTNPSPLAPAELRHRSSRRSARRGRRAGTSGDGLAVGGGGGAGAGTAAVRADDLALPPPLLADEQGEQALAQGAVVPGRCVLLAFAVAVLRLPLLRLSQHRVPERPDHLEVPGFEHEGGAASRYLHADQRVRLVAPAGAVAVQHLEAEWVVAAEARQFVEAYPVLARPGGRGKVRAEGRGALAGGSSGWVAVGRFGRWAGSWIGQGGSIRVARKAWRGGERVEADSAAMIVFLVSIGRGHWCGQDWSLSDQCISADAVDTATADIAEGIQRTLLFNMRAGLALWTQDTARKLNDPTGRLRLERRPETRLRRTESLVPV